MTLHLHMGTVSYLTEFFPVPHVKKDYSVHFYHSPGVVFCGVLEQQMLFFLSFKTMIKPHKFYRGVYQNMPSAFVWTLMISWHFLCSFIFPWLKYFWGEKKTILPTARLWLELQCFTPQKWLSLCGAMGSSEARGIAFAFSASLAWEPRPNGAPRPGSAAGSGGKIHDVYYQPALETDALRSQLWSYK